MHNYENAETLRLRAQTARRAVLLDGPRQVLINLFIFYLILFIIIINLIFY